MSYRVILAHEAEKILDRLDRSMERRIRARLVQLADDPFDPRLSGALTERAGVRRSTSTHEHLIGATALRS